MVKLFKIGLKFSELHYSFSEINEVASNWFQLPSIFREVGFYFNASA